jgi:hypothetical protein
LTGALAKLRALSTLATGAPDVPSFVRVADDFGITNFLTESVVSCDGKETGLVAEAENTGLEAANTGFGPASAEVEAEDAAGAAVEDADKILGETIGGCAGEDVAWFDEIAIALNGSYTTGLFVGEDAFDEPDDGTLLNLACIFAELAKSALQQITNLKGKRNFSLAHCRRIGARRCAACI